MRIYPLAGTKLEPPIQGTGKTAGIASRFETGSCVTGTSLVLTMHFAWVRLYPVTCRCVISFHQLTKLVGRDNRSADERGHGTRHDSYTDVMYRTASNTLRERDTRGGGAFVSSLTINGSQCPCRLAPVKYMLHSVLHIWLFYIRLSNV